MSELPMNYIIFGTIAFICICFIIYFVANNFVRKENNKNETDNETTNEKIAHLMLFYADWCPHCKTSKPEWNSLKEEYDGKNINGYIVVFEEYNCSDKTAENEELMDKYNVEGFPTVKLIKDNQVIEYEAKVTKKTLEQFLTTVL